MSSPRASRTVRDGIAVSAPSDFVCLRSLGPAAEGEICAWAPVNGFIRIDPAFFPSSGGLRITVCAAIGSPNDDPGRDAMTFSTDRPTDTIVGSLAVRIHAAIGGFVYKDKSLGGVATKEVIINYPFLHRTIVIEAKTGANAADWTLVIDGPDAARVRLELAEPSLVRLRAHIEHRDRAFVIVIDEAA